MCGIAIAISTKNHSIQQDLMKGMTDVIAHRGPDGDGFYFESNFAFGHRRLAIIDLSKDGLQPMLRHNLVITFNGEIFNYIELREELRSYGYSFETETDTEVILNAYRHWGYECQDHFTGMWAFALYDPSKNILFCSRDRFCIKPFVYMQCGEYFLIGSEIKQFLHFDGFQAVLNKNVAFDFLERGWLNHTNETFFEKVYSLDGGHQLIYNLSDHSYSISKWYHPDFTELKIDFEQAKVEYTKLLTQSIKLRLRSDVTVGIALSGGIDSSGIVCLTRQLDTKGHYKAVTSCYSKKQYDESYYAECIATKTGVDLKKTYPNLDDLITNGSLDKMIWHQEQPISSASHFSEFSVLREAHNQKIKVMLCGQGPDEHSAGYNSYFSIYQLSLLKRFKIKKLSSILRSAQGSRYSKYKRFAGFLFLNSLKQKRSDFLNMNYFSKRSAKPKMGIFLEADTIRKLSIQEIFTTSIPYQAHSEDRNSMCFSIESRSPYLDHALLEFAVKLPDDHKIRNNTNKFILRKVLKPYLPREVYERKDKMGFVAPDEIWFKENHGLIRPNLEEACMVLQNAVNGFEIMTYYDGYVKGNFPFSPIFLKILSLASLCKQYNFQV